MPAPVFDEHARRNAETLIELAFAEDLGSDQPFLHFDAEAGRTRLQVAESLRPPRDITSECTIPADAVGSALFVSRSEGVIAGLPVLPLVARRFGPGTSTELLSRDGEPAAPGTAVARINGPMRELLRIERTALNFLQRLSGIATMTGRFVKAVAGTSSVILDTRKTTPGWRALEKYAVRCGGGTNHRFGLHDAVLMKDNHLEWLTTATNPDPIGSAVSSARRHAPLGTIIEVEVDSLDQFNLALACRPDIILLDNFHHDEVVEAVRRRRDAGAAEVLLEASGGITLPTLATYAFAGIDRISVGALTHSAPALDIGLDFERPSP